jgi:hypothetical protein
METAEMPNIHRIKIRFQEVKWLHETDREETFSE